MAFSPSFQRFDRFCTVLAYFGCLHLYYNKKSVKINQFQPFSFIKKFL